MTSWCLPIQSAGVHVAECGGCALGYHGPGYHAGEHVAECVGCALHSNAAECGRCAYMVSFVILIFWGVFFGGGLDLVGSKSMGNGTLVI